MSGLIIHEWLEKIGGSERVLDEFVAMHEDADVHVLWANDDKRYPGRVSESWISKTPLRGRKALALPLLPTVWRHVPARRDYEWMLISSHLFAHHARIKAQPDLEKFVYAHTPARYVWEPDLDRRGDSLAARALSVPLKRIDALRAKEATHCVANSNFTRSRVEATWEIECGVIYPPVDVEHISAAIANDDLDDADRNVLASLPDDFVLGASRFVDYKRLEEVIVAGDAAGLPVVIAGAGPAEARLRARAERASVPVSFVIRPSTNLLWALYARAAVMVFLAVEDFGIMPIECMAAGTPVVGYHTGGVAETLQLTRGGVVTQSLTPDDLRQAVEKALSLDPADFAAAVRQFSSARFRDEIRTWMSGASHTLEGTYE